MTVARERYVKKRHWFYRIAAHPIGRLLALPYGFRFNIYHEGRGGQYLVLANHQSLLDPVYLAISFPFPLYMVASDTLFDGSLKAKALFHCFAPIKKKKAAADIQCIRTCLQVAKEGGSIGIFPEGNRAWADYPFYIDKSICKLIRMLKLPVLFYHFSGGYGADPRWGAAPRKGRFTGAVVSQLSVEEIAALSDASLYQLVLSSLRVIDSESGELYRSRRRAEYLERELFLCPRCAGVSTLRSEGNVIRCRSCGMEASYGEDLLLHSHDDDFPFRRLAQWYEHQVRWVKDYKPSPGAVIWQDTDVELFDKTGKRQILLDSGTLTMTDTALRLGDVCIPLSDIVAATVVSGTKLVVSTAEQSYIFRGDARFNSIKYLLMRNILQPADKEDPYYGLSIQH